MVVAERGSGLVRVVADDVRRPEVTVKKILQFFGEASGLCTG
jgi:hypothetical protein